VDRQGVSGWVEAYEAAWRTPGTGALLDLFAPDVDYAPSPWASHVGGIEELARFWEEEREGPDEPFVLSHEVVAVDGDSAVVRVSVEYLGSPPSRWRDLWVLRFGDDGRCTGFEEWPFAPDQSDGH
jgi:ketosteroid isomerase-like protein